MGTLKHIRKMLVAAGIVMTLAFTAPGASALTLTSSVAQSGHAGFAVIYPITGEATFNYTAQNYLLLTSIDSLSITLKIFDGDTAPGDFDVNNLILELDGVDTGITLNGFRNGFIDELTITGSPINTAAILSGLQADGRLVAKILDLTPGDNDLNLTSSFQTTLVLESNTNTNPTPTPEPATLSLLGLGLGGLFMYRRRQH
jgi:PEP-CTERM motif-containing protein